MIKQRSGDRRYGVVWRYFEMDPIDCTKACCKICKKTLVRGNSPRSFSTTPLIHHLKKHPDLFVEYQRLQHEVTLRCDNSKEKRSHARVSWSGSSMQIDGPPSMYMLPPPVVTGVTAAEPTMLIKFAKRQNKQLVGGGNNAMVKFWPRDHPSAINLDNLLANMIVVDNKSVSVVKEPGFASIIRHLAPQYIIPPRKFFATAKVPELFSTTMSYVASILNTVDACQLSLLLFQLKTKASTSSIKSIYYFAASWIDASWSRKTAVLHCTNAEDLNSAGSFHNATAQALSHWDIEETRVHAIIHLDEESFAYGEQKSDEAALNLDPMRHPSCIIESLITEVLQNQNNVRNVVQKCQKLREHFEESLDAAHTLHGLQQALSAPLHKLNTNGNVYDLFSRIAEQRLVIAEYIRVQDAQQVNLSELNLTESEWVLLDQLLVLLGPFREASKMMRKQNAHIGSVIPAVTLLKRCYEKLENSDAGRLLKNDLGSLMNDLKAAIRSGSRMANFEAESFFSVACLLDPRYKQEYFTKPSCVSKTKIFVVSEAVRLTVQVQQSLMEVSEDRSSVAELNGETDGDSSASQTRVAGNSSEQHSPSTNSTSLHALQSTATAGDDAKGITDQKSSITTGQEETNDDSTSERIWRDAELELEAYINEPISNSLDEDVTNWWRTAASRFPLLANVGRKYLSASLHVALEEFDGSSRPYADLLLSKEQLLILRANQYIAMNE